MADEPSPSEGSTRWTCEACGCHTNTESDDPVSCGVCGTRRVSSLLLRRGILASSSGFDNHHQEEDDDVEDEEDHDDDEDENSDDDEDEDEDEEEEHEENDSQNENEMDSSLMRSSPAIPRRARRGGSNRGGSGSATSSSSTSASSSAAASSASLSVAPILLRPNSRRSNASRGSSNIADSDDLLAAASANSGLYSPRWSDSHRGSSIQIDEKSERIACLAEGGEEGRSVRALEAVPTVSDAAASNTAAGKKRRPVFGWRMVFEHPTRDKSRSLGGCYLVGVTTDQFADFGERSGLQQSRLFWGVEDGGRRYEGGGTSSTSGSRRGNSSGGAIIQLTREEAPRNSDNVLFGSREVLTVVADLEARTLNYWREGTFLGTLVSGVPKQEEGISLYPVAVPFNAGVCVAVCGLDSDPLSIMAEYHAAQKVMREQRNEVRRRALQDRKIRLLHGNGKQKLSLDLVDVLRLLFSWYSSPHGTDEAGRDEEEVKLNALQAARLWYRCGLRLSQLKALLNASSQGTPSTESTALDEIDGKVEHTPIKQHRTSGGFVTFDNFISTIEKVVEEEEQPPPSKSSGKAQRGASGGSQGSNSSIPEPMDTSITVEGSEGQSSPAVTFEVGDKVEVCEGYDRFGDAASGPLRPGDLGTVLEVQRGPRGDRQSIRVLYNGRRWWYQPQALLSERSGLVESSSIRFLSELLRSHGYSADLTPLVGKTVTAQSWKPGDFVCLRPDVAGEKSKPTESGEKKSDTSKSAGGKEFSGALLGRITVDSSSSSSTAGRRESELVNVDFCTSTSGPARKIKVDRLVHTDFYHGLSALFCDSNASDVGGVLPMESDCDEVEKIEKASSMAIDEIASSSENRNVEAEEDANKVEECVSTDLAKKLALVSKLDKQAISTIIKECRTPPSLARMYAAGLPEAILKAIAFATENECDASSVSSLGALVLAVSKGLFPEQHSSITDDEGGVIDGDSLPSSSPARSEGLFEEGGDNTAEASGSRPRSNRSSRDITNSVRAVAEQQLRSGNHPAGGISVREFVRDLGVGPEQRRGVLLALMASARMHDDPHSHSASARSSLGRLMASSSSSDFLVASSSSEDRGRQLLSSFGRLSAEAPSGFGFSSSSNDQNEASGQGATNSSSALPASSSSSSPPSWSRSLLRANASSAASGLARSRSMSSSVKGLIHNGLLLNSPEFVKKMLSAISSTSSSSSSDFSKVRDEEDNSILFLGVALGCSQEIIQLLLAGGCNVTRKELEECARTNQHSSLKFLLRQTVYTPDSINVSCCSPEVIQVLADAVERQIRQEDSMRSAAVSFSAVLLGKFVDMALRFRRDGRSRDSHARTSVDVLVGEVLLHAIHQSQNQALDAGRNAESESTSAADDGRVPAFPTGSSTSASSSSLSKPIGRTEGSETAQTGNKSNIRCTQLSLIDILPPSVFLAAFDPSLCTSGSLTSYLSLTEAYLWKKEMKHSVVGLTLACTLLSKAPSTCCVSLMGRRYGLGELAACHVEMANDALSEIHLRGSSGNEDPGAVAPVVKCPKGHTTILHLTRHSSFRCDLCGKGVEQGKPMHGCRECDWDACEACTDKAEGGLVKWRHIKRLATECQEKLSSLSSSVMRQDETDNQQRQELQSIATGIRGRNVESVSELGQWLGVPGKLTLYEFVSFILPALHASIAVGGGSGGACGASFGSLVLASKPRTTSRRSKKPRVGGSSKKQPTKRSNEALSENSVKTNRKAADEWVVFVRSLVSLLGSSSIESETSVSGPSSSAEKGCSGDAFDEETEDDLLEEASHEDEDNNMEESDPYPTARGKTRKRDAKFVPEILRRLHAVLAFHERVVVTRCQSSSSTSENGGELQSLLVPFEIELYRVQKSTGHRENNSDNCDGSLSRLTEKASVNRARQRMTSSESCSNLQGAVVSMEPLMPLAELQLHILRCCRVRVPAYLRFCRRLAQERAIIAERPACSSQLIQEVSSGSDTESSSWRIAQVVAFDEKIGAHVVRYASHVTSQQPDLFNAEEDMLEPDNVQTIADQLQFNGREAMLILASRDYCILHRDRQHEESFIMDHDHAVEDVMMQDVESVDQANVDTCLSPAGNEGVPAEQRENASVSSLLLPFGTRVESDVNDDGWKVYTIISSSFEVTGIANILNEDINSLTSQLETSVRAALTSDTDGQSESMLGKLFRYGLVSETGEVIQGVPGSKIRGHDSTLQQRCMHQQRGHSAYSDPQSFVRGHNIFDRGIHITSVRRSASAGNSDRHESGNKTKPVGVLRRTWSALSPIQDMCPLELSASNNEDVNVVERSLRSRTRKMSIGGDGVKIAVDLTAVEQPPILTVELSLSESQPAVALSNVAGTTLYSGLRRLNQSLKSKSSKKAVLDRKCKIFYSISMRWGKGKGDCRKELSDLKSLSFTPPWIKRRSNEEPSCHTNENEDVHDRDGSEELVSASGFMAENEMEESLMRCTEGQSANDSSDLDETHSSKGNDDLSLALINCEGLDDVSVHCMQLLNFLGDTYVNFASSEKQECAGNTVSKRSDASSASNRKGVSSRDAKDTATGIFVSDTLTHKLLEQLEDPLSVVGGALPDWCSMAPALSPRVFSHASRRLLLERAAFGISRAALRQQEAKIAVGPLRQRMAALRGRAVELVGEAFSGGAADPTALQLQADELYGMEEALAARVNAAFRAQRWDERSLQCAKAAVRRDRLLSDAAVVMDRYACDASVNRRRLEVRFEGESGFDAASGDEAGVTRGFYADVAEALLSHDRVASIHCATSCPRQESQMIVDHNSDGYGDSARMRKLPLWIPDFDASGRVVIPTPRSDVMSGLGVFPRPLDTHHPLRPAVLNEFRFMGRLFAAAMRDGFVFPLPLSVSFLKLVQSRACADDRFVAESGALSSGIRLLCRPSNTSSNASVESDYLSNNSSVLSSAASSPVMSLDDSCGGGASVVLENSSFSGDAADISLPWTDRHCILNSEDLPRPGFLGGDVYAVERYICVALDTLEETEPDLIGEQKQERMDEIAADKSFARRALGKAYDCSFEDYFEGRTFVDPLDPSQGDDAFPLCRDGAKKAVTINNVREWVRLSKHFILQEGVLAQAIAFRQGVNDFFSADALLLLTPEELQRDVCGGGDNVDSWTEDSIRALFKLDGGKGAAEALVAVAAMGGEGGAALSRRFGPSSPTIGYLVKSLLEANTTQRRQFLSFVTSVPIVTPGQIEVVPVVSPAGEFLPMSDNCLPRANTCARRLYLPKFENFESFSKVFFSVVREESRFKGFFEWRG